MHFILRFIECFFCWRLQLPEWSDEAQAICACTFGRTDDTCNQAIALHVSEKSASYAVPYCVQREIGHYVVAGLSGYASAESQDTHGRAYTGTYETVHEQVTCYLQSQGVAKIHVEAHPDHAWRVVMCYKRLGMDVVSLCMKGKPYPKHSTQVWCQSRIRFIPYEILARLLYLIKRYV